MNGKFNLCKSSFILIKEIKLFAVTNTTIYYVDIWLNARWLRALVWCMVGMCLCTFIVLDCMDICRVGARQRTQLADPEIGVIDGGYCRRLWAEMVMVSGGKSRWYQEMTLALVVCTQMYACTIHYTYIFGIIKPNRRHTHTPIHGYRLCCALWARQRM